MAASRKLTVYEGDIEPTLNSMSIKDLLAEPMEKSGQWMPAVSRRLVAASNYPIAVGITNQEKADRLEAAGWLGLSEDANIKAARNMAWPNQDHLKRLGIGYGSAAPKIVIVGEKATNKHEPPLASRTGTWVFAALRRLGYDELSCFVVNAYDPNGKRRTDKLRALEDIFKDCKPIYLAIGKKASLALKFCGIPHSHVKSSRAHWNFTKNGDVDSYAKLMHAAGLPTGRWYGLGIATANCPELPFLPAPYDLRTVAYKRGQKRQAQSSAAKIYVEVSKANAARLLFVTGQVKTIKEAAEKIKISAGRLGKLAQQENWTGEREAHMREKTRLAKEASAKAEAKASANCRTLAWAATELALSSVVRELQSGHYKARAKDAKALAEVSVMLSEKVMDPKQSIPELENKTIIQLVNDVQTKIAKGLGGGIGL